MSDLVSPLVDNWHVNVVDEYRHSLACRWPIRRANTFVNVALYCTLAHNMKFTPLSCCHFCGRIYFIVLCTITIYRKRVKLKLQ